MIAARARSNILNALKRSRAQSVPLEEARADSSASQRKPPAKKATSCKVGKTMNNKKGKSSKEVEPIPTGLKLLKRGCVTMHRIVGRKINGKKITVLFNKKGQPYGAAANEMQSYIGVLARTKAPIWRPTWKQVPADRKNKIWECVKVFKNNNHCIPI